MEEKNDPRNYFKFNSCSRCSNKPCNQLRFGGVYPGKFVLVHSETMEPGFNDCPFLTQDIDEIQWLINRTPEAELCDRIDGVLQSLTTEEIEYFRQFDFMSGVCDMPGMTLLVKELYENRVVSIFRIPQLFRNDAAVRKWLLAF
jgi:hypothetical protein